MILLTFVGDCFPANLPYKIGYGIAAKFKEDMGKSWGNSMYSFFQNSFLSFCNLEAPLIKNQDEPEFKAFAGSEDFAKYLKDIGINIVSVANNHISEQGSEGFFNTLAVLNKVGISYVGKLEKSTSNIVYQQHDNNKIGFVAFSSIIDKHNNSLYAELNFECVKKSLDEMKINKCDLIILSFHWGNEYVHIPAYWQIELAHRLIDYGADIIIGHHPHVIQPVEKYNSGLIFYSLGNFLFDMSHSPSTRLGLIAKVTNIINPGELNYELIPVFIDNNYTPIILHKNQKVFYLLNKRLAKMRFLYSKGQNEYDHYYNKLVKINRFKNRVLMKIDLVKNLSKLSSYSIDFLIDRILKRR